MLDTAVKDRLLEILEESRVIMDANMGDWTSFKVGGAADCLVQPNSIEEIKAVVTLAKENDIPLYIIGNGTNILVRDGGLDGIVIGLYQHYNEVDIDEETGVVTVQSGALLSAIANYACRSGLSGLEFAGGIPGCLGGAIRMNAGAYGGEICDVIENVTVLHEDMTIETYEKCGMDFGYRHSCVKDGDIVLGAVMQLEQADKGKIRNKMVGFAKRRKEKQPLNMASAGSTFKRPEGYYAGKLIEDAGLKGHTIGGAQVSPKHAGFIVNTGKATAKDIED